MKSIFYFAASEVKNGERFMKSESPRGARGFDTFDSIQLYASIDMASLSHNPCGGEYKMIPVYVDSIEGLIPVSSHPNKVNGSFSSSIELESNPLAEKAYMDSMDSDKKKVISNLKKIDIDFDFLDGYNSHLVEFSHDGEKFVASIKEATNIYDLKRLLEREGVKLPYNFTW